MQKFSKLKNLKTFIITTIFLGCYIGFDLGLNDIMWNGNTYLTVYLQTHQFNKELELMNFFSDYLNIFPAMALLNFLVRNNKLDSLLYGGVVVFVNSANAILKNIYHQARPFWIEDEIKSYQCNKEFGKPSGHAMGSITMIFLIPSILFPAIWKNQPNVQYPIIIRIVIILVLIFWMFMTGFSRIFFGAHSFGQVLLGWVYAGYAIINYMVYLHKPLGNYLKQCLSQENYGLSWKFVLIVIAMMISWGLFSFMFYEFNQQELGIDQTDIDVWLDAMHQKCKATPLYTDDDASVLQNNCFKNSFQITFILFLIIGAKISRGTYNEGLFIQNFMKMKWYIKIIRILLLPILLLTIEPFVFFIITESLLYSIWSQTIPMYLVGALVITLLYPIVLHILRLDIEGDFLRMRKDIPIKVTPIRHNSDDEIMNSSEKQGNESPNNNNNQLESSNFQSKREKNYPESDSLVINNNNNQQDEQKNDSI